MGVQSLKLMACGVPKKYISIKWDKTTFDSAIPNQKGKVLTPLPLLHVVTLGMRRKD